MNTFLSGGLSILVLSPALAGPPPSRASYPLPGQAVVSVLPASVGDGGPARNPVPLRDMLRQSMDGLDDPAATYRLSIEERQRLREQVRSQSPYGHNK